MDSPLSVLLRDGTHAAASTRLAHKVDSVQIVYGKSPVQVTVASGDPILLDLGISRPSIVIAGIVDTTGGDQSNTSSATDNVSGNTYAFKGMESLTIGSQTYYVPYKNYLEEKIVTWQYSEALKLQLEIGDATTPEATSGAFATGGGIYEVAITNVNFSAAPALEDRWVFNITFMSKLREGISF